MSSMLGPYLEGYAEPEVALAEQVPGPYGAVLVVPVHDEAPDFLRGYGAALAAAAQKRGSDATAPPSLVVVVLNAEQSASAVVHKNHEALRQVLRAAGDVQSLDGAPPAFLVRTFGHHVLLIDRAVPGHFFPPKNGVGLARKLGHDVALALIAQGKVASQFIRTSDGDVTAPADYLLDAWPFGPPHAEPDSGASGRESGTATLTSEAPKPSVLLYPFEHVPTGDTAIDEATLLYELWLRYYVLGLAHAGSPYAFHTIGSTLAVHAEAYAQVRGFPRREAAEDFYLLNKLSKVAPVRRVQGGSLHVAARRSSRVPFGTGRRVTELTTPGATQLRFYHPELFSILGIGLELLDALAAEGPRARGGGTVDAAAVSAFMQARLDAIPAARLPPAVRVTVSEQIASGKTAASLAGICRQAPPQQRRRRVHELFDAFRTLRLVNVLVERHYPSIDFREALAEAPFVTGLSEQEPGAASVPELQRLLVALRALEAALPPDAGPALL